MTKDAEPFAIVGGNPVKVIRKRFSDREIALLLEMRWWEWSDDRLKDAMPIMTSERIGDLHRYWLSA